MLIVQCHHVGNGGYALHAGEGAPACESQCKAVDEGAYTSMCYG